MYRLDLAFLSTYRWWWWWWWWLHSILLEFGPISSVTLEIANSPNYLYLDRINISKHLDFLGEKSVIRYLDLTALACKNFVMKKKVENKIQIKSALTITDWLLLQDYTACFTYFVNSDLLIWQPVLMYSIASKAARHDLFNRL